jgi:hypothetical protein
MLPLVRGLYLVERVDVNPVTRNLALHECFRTLSVAGLPASPQPFAVVAFLANGDGRYPFAVRVTRLDTMAVIYTSSAVIAFPNRLEEVRFVFRVRRCIFPGAGAFEVSLWIGGELLAQTPFQVGHLREG